MSSAPNRLQTIRHLTQQLRRWEKVQRGQGGERVSTGIAALDEMLPERGLGPGTLIEWLGTAAGGGAGTLAFAVAAGVMRQNRPGGVVVIDPEGAFHPPAVLLRPASHPAPAGLRGMIVVRPPTDADAWWAWEQALRCSGVAAVLGRIERLPQRIGRRLQLAAETGGGLGLLLRPAPARGAPSWADIRLGVEPAPLPQPDRGASGTDVIGWRGRSAGSPRFAESPTTGASASRSAARHPAHHQPQGEPTGGLGKSSGHASFPPAGSAGRRVRVELLHCRGGVSGGTIDLEIDDETGDVRVAPRVAAAAPAVRAQGG